jgi:hypothetical protein
LFQVQKTKETLKKEAHCKIVKNTASNFFRGEFFNFFLFMYVILHFFICRPSDSTVSEDVGFEPKTVATLALTARRSELPGLSGSGNMYFQRKLHVQKKKKSIATVQDKY